jgi:hypothetical protein
MLTSLSDAGAQRINVFTNWGFRDYLIVVTLPSDRYRRQLVRQGNALLERVDLARDLCEKLKRVADAERGSRRLAGH